MKKWALAFGNTLNPGGQDHLGSSDFHIHFLYLTHRQGYPDNPLVRAMYWLQKDFYEKKEINITTPHAVPIFKMRNDMEHNCLRTGKQPENLSFTVYTTEGKIEQNTFQLLKLAREIIIYLCLAINFDIGKDKNQFDTP